MPSPPERRWPRTAPTASFRRTLPRFAVTRPASRGSTESALASLSASCEGRRRGIRGGRILKTKPGGDLSLGGADLVAAFMEHDLVDEHRNYVHPVRIGRGKRLFGPSDRRTTLRLVESRAFGNGVVLLRYPPVRAVSPR
jgi:hypothetical protein